MYKQNKNTTFRLAEVKSSRRGAFTLAEVLIALGIIGIVAAMTIPSLIMKYKEKSWATASSVFEQKLEQSLRLMNTSEQLSGRQTTENFLNTLSNYMKITKICDNNNLNQCFRDEFVDTTDSVLKLSELKTSKQIALDDWGTNTLGVQFANGVSALVAYNKDCKVDAFSNNSPVMSCISMIYDTNGTSTPNKLSKDIHAINNNRNLFAIAVVNGVKITNIAKAGTYETVDCTNPNGKDYKYCYNSTEYTKDYWSGAAKYCGGKENLANQEELTELAKHLYNDPNFVFSHWFAGISTTIIVTPQPERITEFNNIGFPNPSFYVWLPDLNNSYPSTNACSLCFGESTAYWTCGGSPYRNDSHIMAVCVKH